MKLDEQEQKLGVAWFFIIGPVALLTILFLAKADIYLTYSDSEKKHAATMHELRLAQTSLASATLDARNAGERAFKAPATDMQEESVTALPAETQAAH